MNGIVDNSPDKVSIAAKAIRSWKRDPWERYSHEFLDFAEIFYHRIGVYEFLDNQGNSLYIGQSKTLGRRSMSSFLERNFHQENERVYCRYYITDNIADAHLLEVYLICKRRPKKNRQYKSDHTTSYQLSGICNPTKRVNCSVLFSEKSPLYDFVKSLSEQGLLREWEREYRKGHD